MLFQLRCSFHTDCRRLVVSLGDLLLVLLMQLIAVLVRIKGRVVLRLDLASCIHGTLHLKSVNGCLLRSGGHHHLSRRGHMRHAFNLFVANHLVIISL